MSTLKVNRIEPRTGDTVEIVGFGGGVSNIHMSSKTGATTYSQGVWSRHVMDVNHTASTNTNYNVAAGVYKVGVGEGGIYFTNFNCNVYGNSQLWDADSSVYVKRRRSSLWSRSGKHKAVMLMDYLFPQQDYYS